MSISISRIRREGIDKVKTKGNYSFEFKLSVVKLYLITEASYQEMALSVGINNPAMLSQWVNNYRAVRPDALRPKRRVRKPKVK